MNTVDELLLAALQARLTSAALGASVERDRVIPFNREDLPAIVIKPKSNGSELLANGMLRCDLTIEIEVHTRGQIPSLLADAIAYGISTAVKSDSTFGGLCAKCWRVSKDWEFSDADQAGGKLVISYTLRYHENA